jgi:hypothetical protein
MGLPTIGRDGKLYASKEQVAARRIKVRELKDQGLGLKQIAETIGASLRVVQEDSAKLSKNRPVDSHGSIPNEHGKKNGATRKQSLAGLRNAAVQIQGLAEAVDGQLLGDWHSLFGYEEAEEFFDLIETHLPVLTARLKRVLKDRRQQT